MKKSTFVATIVAAGGVAGSAYAGTTTLSTGAGDGGVSVLLDAYGGFGSSASPAGNATYNPIGPEAAAGTTFESAVAFRVGGAGSRQFLAEGDIGDSGGLPSVSFTNTTGTSASSSFTRSGLNFGLVQMVQPAFSGDNVRAGSVLTQTYTITNNTGGAVNDLELVRYVDGDLLFDGSLEDGGGRLVQNGTEILFETDTAAGTAAATTFFGITGEGGQVPSTNRFEADSFSALRGRVISGTALDGQITGDGPDADQFVDAGEGYDITLTLRNIFDIAAGGSATYTTRTIFGTGAPEDIVVPPPTDPGPGPGPNPIPLPAAVWAGLSLFGGMGMVGAVRRRFAKA